MRVCGTFVRQWNTAPESRSRAASALSLSEMRLSTTPAFVSRSKIKDPKEKVDRPQVGHVTLREFGTGNVKLVLERDRDAVWEAGRVSRS